MYIYILKRAEICDVTSRRKALFLHTHKLKHTMCGVYISITCWVLATTG